MAPGDYNPESGFKLTIPKDREVKFSKSKIPNFIDAYKRAHKFVPGAG